MHHYTFLDLKIFEAEFKNFGHEQVSHLLKDGDTFFIKFKNSDFCVKFYSSFPGYRVVHVPYNLIRGDEILNDLFPAKVLMAKILNNDRIFGIWLENRNMEFALIFELLGSLSNLFVLNEDGKVIYMGRRVKDQRSLRPGVIYTLPEKKQFAVLQQLPENFDVSEVKTGFICKLGDDVVLEFNKPSNDLDCMAYFPYTYALDVFFGEIYSRKLETSFSPSQVEEIITFLEKNFSNDAILDNEYILIGENKFSVPKGIKVSKLIGELRARLLSFEKNAKGEREKRFLMKGVFEFKSPSGKRVLVGRSAQANHKITFNLGKRDDLLFHVSGYKGAHVLLVNDGTPITEEDIKFCATLALKFSDAGTGKWEVMYAPVKYVYRSKSMPVGMVMFKKYSSVLVEK